MLRQRDSSPANPGLLMNISITMSYNMFRIYASDYHSYTRLILALGIVKEPTVWGFIFSQYPDIHDISRASDSVTPVYSRYHHDNF